MAMRRRVGMLIAPFWWVFAAVWVLASYSIIVEYAKYGDPKYFHELWFVCSLFWAQFGFALIFSALLKTQKERVYDLLFLMLFPPLLLHFILFSFVL